MGVSRLSLPLPEAKLRRDVLRALRLAEFGGAMSLAVVDDTTMRNVNRDYHAVDAPTDVLAFPLSEARGGDAGFDAEVIVSLDTARREAKARGVEPSSELMLYVVHGTLHLLGHDDHDPKAASRMHRATLAILSRLGYANTIDGLAPRKRDAGRRLSDESR
jgi:probable rRNA maturation factor